MSDENDIFDENLARLLRRAPGPPVLGRPRKRRMLDELRHEFRRTAAAARRRAIMKRCLQGLAAAAAAAAIVLGIVLASGPKEPTPAPHVAAAGKLADGTRVYARSDAKYAVLADRRIRVDKGQVLLFVAKSRAGKPFVVEAAGAQATAKGTIFTVSVDGKKKGETFVAVGQGEVKLTNAVGAVDVRAGHQAVAAPGAPPRRTAAPRFTHLVNWARQQLPGKRLFGPDKPRATGELIAVDPWGQESRLELRRYHVDVVIEDGIARTTVDQTFFNQWPGQTEGTFYFPLPPDASLSRLAMYVEAKGGQCVLNEGGMVDRQYGRFVYESIVYRRRDPALLEMMEGNVFKMRVFPIFGRHEKRILLSYTQTLSELYSTLRYWYPMGQTSQKAGELSIRVRVKGGAGNYEALSSTHQLAGRTDGEDAVLEYTAQDTPPDQDFLLKLTPHQAGAGGAPTLRRFSQGGAHYVFARWRPKLPGAVEIEPRQWFLINDVSASRSSVDVKAQAYIVERLLAEADDGDAFALVNLDTQARPWKRELTAVRDPAGSSVVAFAEAHERLGATNVVAGLEAVAELIAQTGAENPHVVYLGDGIATDGETRVDRLVSMIPETATFIGIGVGKKVDSRFFQSAADATGGMYVNVNPDEDIRWRVFDTVAALNTPRLVEVSAAFTDADGKPVKVAAHPSSGVLSDGEALTVLARCEGKLPARMIVSGQLRGEPFLEEHNLHDARDGAAYIPRLWAAAHIDRLLRTDADAHKDEIVALSKDFYVVTPYTSLIVLENKGEYEKWNVEMGRKDHWQLYKAPAKIKTVSEPLKNNPWSWWGPMPARPVKGKPGDPKTVEEIVDSVQFRVHVPLYGYYPHQRRRLERFRLTALLSGRLPVAGHGALLGPQMPKVPDEEDERRTTAIAAPDVGLDGEWQFPSSRGEDMWGRSRVSSSSFATVMNGRSRGWGLYLPTIRAQLGIGTGHEVDLLTPVGGLRTSGLLGGRLSLEDGLREIAPLTPFGLETMAGTRSGRAGLPMDGRSRELLPLLGLTHEGLFAAPGEIEGLFRDDGGPAKRKRTIAPGITVNDGSMQVTSFIHEYIQPLGGTLLDPRRQRDLGEARFGRWFSDRERIRQFNRRYSGRYYGDWGGMFDDDSRALAAGARLGRAFQPLMRIAATDVQQAVDRLVELPMAKAPRRRPGPPRASSPQPPPPAAVAEEAAGVMLPPVYLQSYARAVGAVPGTMAALAADRIVPLRKKLQAMKPSKKRDRAIAAIDAMIAALPGLSAATENTGAFWSHQGWNTVPSRWEFQQPASQTWPGSRTMTDALRYAGGLQSTWGDVAALVLDAFARKPAGKVTDEAAARIAAARRNAPTQRIQYTTKKGKVLFELWAGAEDRFAWTSTSPMYLREDFICDGESIWHVYGELGIAARRDAKWQLAGLRTLAPHRLPPADAFTRAFHVAIAETDGDLTTLRLTPVAPRPDGPTEDPAKAKAAAEAKARKLADLAVLVTFDGRGLIRDKRWQVKSQTRLACTYTYEAGRVDVAWQAGEKTLGEYGYRCATDKPVGSPFAPKLDKTVVLDMPLRRPAHYEALLKELGTDVAKRDERIRLRRHLAVAQLQEFGWQYPWGSVQTAWKTMQAMLNERLAAGRTELLPGDDAILAAAGYTRSLKRSNLKVTTPDHPMAVYWRNWNNGAEMKKLAAARPGTFVGHLAAHAAIHRGGSDRVAAVKQFFKDYPRSPLAYAVAMCLGSSEVGWLALAELPRWRFVALCTAARRSRTVGIAEAFEAYHKEMTDNGWEVPISSHLAAALKIKIDCWKRVVERAGGLAGESEDVAALLRFAEFAWAHGEKEASNAAVEQARKLVADKLPLTWKLALTQSLWAMGRIKEAWAQQQAVLESLEQAGLKPSPALLAATARLAQQAGQAPAAVEFELSALEAEKPYMPKRINVHLFRQRYQWLWNQLGGRVRLAAAAAKKDPADASARQDLQAALDQAKGVWQTWMRVDSGNAAGLHRNMATLYRQVDQRDEAWRIVSSIIDQKPKDGSSYFQVGQWYVSLGDRDSGEAYYGKAYQVEPTNGDWIWHRAELLKGMGRKDDARKLYEEIAEKKWQPRFQHLNNQAKKRLKSL